MNSFRVLVVDDDPQSLESTGRILEHAGYPTFRELSPQKALDRLQKEIFDLVITDVRMPGMSGMEFFDAAKKLGIRTPFVIMTAFGQIQDAVWAMKMGAVDFLLKPFKRQTLLNSLALVEHRAGHSRELRSEQRWIGKSRKSLELKTLVEQVARTDSSILITGESGSGKEKVAQWIHEVGPRSSRPCVAINCAAIPEALLESELFGHDKGAFSGAHQSKIGLIEAAAGGTLFLDEVGDMPLSLQPKLLRTLEEKKFRRVGSTVERIVDVRVLAATHQNLHQKVQEGSFRADLFFRLDVISLAVPPLRDRSEDIRLLAEFFLERFCERQGQPLLQVEEAVWPALESHHWPGNVRELSNAMERAAVLSDGKLIRLSNLPLSLQPSSHSKNESPISIPVGMSLREVEEIMIHRALDASKGDRAEAARLLGVNERTIYRRLKEFQDRFDKPESPEVK